MCLWHYTPTVASVSRLLHDSTIFSISSCRKTNARTFQKYRSEHPRFFENPWFGAKDEIHVFRKKPPSLRGRHHWYCWVAAVATTSNDVRRRDRYRGARGIALFVANVSRRYTRGDHRTRRDDDDYDDQQSHTASVDLTLWRRSDTNCFSSAIPRAKGSSLGETCK